MMVVETIETVLLVTAQDNIMICGVVYVVAILVLHRRTTLARTLSTSPRLASFL